MLTHIFRMANDASAGESTGRHRPRHHRSLQADHHVWRCRSRPEARRGLRGLPPPHRNRDARLPAKQCGITPRSHRNHSRCHHTPRASDVRLPSVACRPRSAHRMGPRSTSGHSGTPEQHPSRSRARPRFPQVNGQPIPSRGAVAGGLALGHREHENTFLPQPASGSTNG